MGDLELRVHNLKTEFKQKWDQLDVADIVAAVKPSLVEERRRAIEECRQIALSVWNVIRQEPIVTGSAASGARAVADRLESLLRGMSDT